MVLESHTVKVDTNHQIVYKEEKWAETGHLTQATPMQSAYSLIDGSYIGTWDSAKKLAAKGICPQNKDMYPGNSSNIGKSVLDKKWYGWSHRALCGFEIGDVVSAGDVLENYFPVGFVAETDDEAQCMAMWYAEDVG